MTGDFNTIIGNNNQQNVRSTVTSSYNSVKGNYDSDTDTFLKEVADVVEKSGDQQAADHYEELVQKLKNGKKSLARTTWDGLVKILPAVASITGAGMATAKLFGAA